MTPFVLPGRSQGTRRPLALVAVVALGACASVGGVHDGTSVSRGHSNGGQLLNGVALPVHGDGYVIPRTWAERGLAWGTEELVGLVVRAARRVAREAPGGELWVGDLSPPRGGASAWHRSHQSGRDADLLFYMLAADGRPAPPPAQMIRFAGDGLGLDGGHRLDVERTWLLVRALLEDGVVDVQFIFVSTPIKRLLLAHAVDRGEPPELLARTQAVLLQPTGALPHDDHLHVRIYCPGSDRALGCFDRGPLRWFKKTYKYLAAREPVPMPRALTARAPRRPFCQLLAGATTPGSGRASVAVP